MHLLFPTAQSIGPDAEGALYGSRAMRQFVGIDLDNESASTQLRPVSFGTIVNASIIQAPSSTRNKDKTRDPDMHQTRKGNLWYFGMKAHTGVDSQNKLIHSVEPPRLISMIPRLSKIFCMMMKPGSGVIWLAQVKQTASKTSHLMLETLTRKK
jgi:hypothetical protein